MGKVHTLALAMLLLWLGGGSPLARGGQTAGARCPKLPEALILSVTGHPYPEITRALSTVGFHVRPVNAESYRALQGNHHRLLIVPEGESSQLDLPLLAAICQDVEEGTSLLLDGDSPLAGALGVKIAGARSDISQYRWDRYAGEPVRLPARLAYSRFKVSPAFQVLAFDVQHQSPLLVSGSRGSGRFIYSAIPLEPRTGSVFQYLPFLAQAIVDELGIAPSLAADNLCVYLDTGGEPRLDPATVAAQLKNWSVREVHLGAFYGSDSFRAFVPRFIAAAHLQGIAVYAWLEYPMVSTEFWDKHPQWREVTASGHQAIMDWRYHMALEDPACFAAVADLTRRLVLDYDWDGVDFAELYFEAERQIFEKPGDYTPMHPTFRKMFRDRYGLDPMKMFDSDSPDYGPRNPQLRADLQEMRVDLITQLTKQFLEILAGCQAQKPYLQTTLTFIDALRDPTVTERFGVDPNRLLELQKQFPFAVEIEDPYTVWNSSPDRYRAIGEHYRPLLRPGTPLSIDVNVVDRIPAGRPLNKPRGLELYELLANVAANADLVALYAFSTFASDDMRLVPFVLGAAQVSGDTVEEGMIRARRQLIWHAAARGEAVYMDGREWPCRSDSQVVIPAGEHRVILRPLPEPAVPDELRVESLSGNLLAAERSGHHITLTYESRGRCYITLNRRPSEVLCDGTAGIANILGDQDRVCLELPQGKHAVDMQ